MREKSDLCNFDYISFWLSKKLKGEKSCCPNVKRNHSLITFCGFQINKRKQSRRFLCDMASGGKSERTMMFLPKKSDDENEKRKEMRKKKVDGWMDGLAPRMK
jgi:hypothetical protein